jgi:hypothetical protein
LPSILKDNALYRQASAYYDKNPLATDAMAVLPEQNPISAFGVKTAATAAPGDFFVDMRKGKYHGMLRQRPAH